jgi:Patatin-like phospholipase
MAEVEGTAPAVPRSSSPARFEIGLVLSGAVSAGAYTAGVVDFLIEALDAFEAEKSAESPECPRHELCLRVIAGTSAGGMTAALLAGLAYERFEHGSGTLDAGPAGNTLFDAWVNQVDAKSLLNVSDLQTCQEVRSLLDSSVVARIAATALRPGTGEPKTRRYLADPLDILLTVTNLAGVPYPVMFGGCPAKTVMMHHGDRIHFALGKSAVATDGVIPLQPRQFDSPGWKMLEDAAIATGAFPVGLAPQELKLTDRSAYDRRFPGLKLRPQWPDEMSDPYRILCVDGGVVDNEPMGLARSILERDNPGVPGNPVRNSAFILVDVFPYAPTLTDLLPIQPEISALARNFLASVLKQARFKYDELHPEQDIELYTRFMVAPLRRVDDETAKEVEFPLACGSLWGFGGFLDRAFRLHDYHLGRLNCKRFLKYHFALPADGPGRHPLFDSWSEDARRRYKIERKRGTFEPPTPGEEVDVFLPIIPLVGDAARPLAPLPAWPTIGSPQLHDLRKQVRKRLYKIVERLIRQHLPWGVRLAVHPLWFVNRRNVLNRLMNAVRKELDRRGQLNT